ncbi:MAG: hypothetical protein WCP12_08025 [bacterium]
MDKILNCMNICLEIANAWMTTDRGNAKINATLLFIECFLEQLLKDKLMECLLVGLVLYMCPSVNIDYLLAAWKGGHLVWNAYKLIKKLLPVASNYLGRDVLSPILPDKKRSTFNA